MMALKFLSGSSLDGAGVEMQATKSGFSTLAESTESWGTAPATLLFIQGTYTTAWTGEGVSFRAFNTGLDDGFLNSDIEWSFDDVGATYENYDTGVMLLPNDRNVMYGPLASHTWTTAGTKTVTATQRIGGTTRTATFTVTVSEPSAADFDNFIYVSFANNFTGAPAAGGAIQHITTADALKTAAATSNVHLLFRAGEVYDLENSSNDDVFVINRPDGNLLVESFGAGAAPILQQGRKVADTNADAAAFRLTDCGRISFQNIIVNSGYDPLLNPLDTVKGGWDTSLKRFKLCSNTSTVNFRGSMYRCNYYYDCRNTTANMVYSDMIIEDWQDYGLAQFGASNTLFVDGGIIKQEATVQSADGKQDGVDIDDPDHGPFRALLSENFQGIYGVSMRARGGWTTGGGLRVEQPCVRFQTIPGDQTVIRTSLIGCVMDGGLSQCGAGPANDVTVISSAPTLLIDMCDFVCSDWTLVAVEINGGAKLDVRSCRMVRQNTDEKINNFQGFFRLLDKGAAVDNASFQAPVRLYNNTLVNLQSLANNSVAEALINYDEPAGSPDITDNNNLVVDDERGSYADYTPLTADYAPDTGSSALGAATTGLIAFRDIEANIRPATKDIGAYQVST